MKKLINIVTFLLIFLGCSGVSNEIDPDTKISNVKFRVMVSDNITSVEIRLIDQNAAVEDITASSFPWEEEYEVSSENTVFFQIDVSNDEKEEKLSGLTDSYENKKLIDSVNDLSSVKTGHYVVNQTDCMPNSEIPYNSTVTKVVSAHELELLSEVFPHKHGQYEIYDDSESGNNIRSGTATDFGVNKLIDSSTDFTESPVIDTNDWVKNISSDSSVVEITGIDETELDLDSDIFPGCTVEYKIYEPRYIRIEVYVDDELFKETEKTDWSEIETALTCRIPAKNSE